MPAPSYKVMNILATAREQGLLFDADDIENLGERKPIIFHLYANLSVPEINPQTPRQFSSPGIFFCQHHTVLSCHYPEVTRLSQFKNNHYPPVIMVLCLPSLLEDKER